MIKKLLICLLPMMFLCQMAITEEITPPATEENISLPQENTPAPMPQVSYKTAFIKMILILIGIIAFAVFTLYMFKKLSRSHFLCNEEKMMKILEKKPLSPKSMLYLMDVEGQKIIIMESQIQLTAKIIKEKQQ
jgi:flagellar biogenesis protein FliO